MKNFEFRTQPEHSTFSIEHSTFNIPRLSWIRIESEFRILHSKFGIRNSEFGIRNSKIQNSFHPIPKLKQLLPHHRQMIPLNLDLPILSTTSRPTPLLQRRREPGQSVRSQFKPRSDRHGFPGPPPPIEHDADGLPGRRRIPGELCLSALPEPFCLGGVACPYKFCVPHEANRKPRT